MARTWLDYAGIAQAQEFAQAQRQQQALQFQQAQQDRQRQQAAQAAAGNALPQLMQPPPQAPAPGQPSQPAPQPQQPMQQAGGGVPLPQGPVPGQVQPPPIPPGGTQGQMPPQGVPPFRPMPSSPPPQQAAPASIGAPPAQQQQVSPQQDQMEGGFSLSNIIQSGQKQGLSGSDLYDYVQTMEPYMTAQQKAKAEQFKTQIELKKLDAEIALHQQASQNQQLSLAERVKHDRAVEEAMNRRIGIQQGNLNIRIQGAGGGAGAAQAEPDKPLANANWESDAQAIASGRMAPIPLSSRAKGAQDIMARVSAINPEYDAKDYGTQATANKYWSTGKGGQQVNTINTAFSHVGNLQDTSRELQNGGVPAWNAFANRVAGAAGEPAPKDFNAQKAIVAGEVVKAIVGAGGGTREDRGEIQQLFDAANTPEQMAGVMGKVRELMSGKLEAMNRQYKKSTGKDDFSDYLSPEAASYLPKGGGKATPSPAGGTTKTIGNKTYVQRNGTWYEQ